MNSQITASKAINFLVKSNKKYFAITRQQRKNLAMAFAATGNIVYGRAFDAVKLRRKINLDSLQDVQKNLESIVLVEVKSTNRRDIQNFDGYFFGLTAAELLTSQSIGKQFEFAFINIETKEIWTANLHDIFARMRAIYPTFSIRF